MSGFLVSTLILLFCGREALAQSLAEAARKEAERRKVLHLQGIEGKVISRESLAGNSGATVSTSKLPQDPRRTGPARSPQENRRNVTSFRSALLRLDQNIRQFEDRLAALKVRLEDEKYTFPRIGRNTGRSGGRSTSNSTRERLRRQIEEIQVRLTRLRQDRLETYDAGRKAGFMPGELDGHGVVP